MKLNLTEEEALDLWWRVTALSTEEDDLMDDDGAQLVANAEKDLNAILLSWRKNDEAQTPETLIASFPKPPTPNPLFARYLRFLATAYSEAQLDLSFPVKAKVYRLLVQLADTYNPPT